MTRYQMIYQYLDANAITNIVDAYIKGRRDLYKEHEDLIIGLTKEEARRIRQDAIDEVINKCSKEYQVFSDDTVCKIWLSDLEKLKEKN